MTTNLENLEDYSRATSPSTDFSNFKVVKKDQTQDNAVSISDSSYINIAIRLCAVSSYDQRYGYG